MFLLQIIQMQPGRQKARQLLPGRVRWLRKSRHLPPAAGRAGDHEHLLLLRGTGVGTFLWAVPAPTLGGIRQVVSEGNGLPSQSCHSKIFLFMDDKKNDRLFYIQSDRFKLIQISSAQSCNRELILHSYLVMQIDLIRIPP